MGTHVGNNFDEKQIIAIDLLAQGYNCTKTAELIGMSLSAVTRWRQNPQFLQAVVDKARDYLRAELPGLYKTASSKAVLGSDRHLKIILDHLDNIDKRASEDSSKNITFTWNFNEPKNTEPEPTED